MVSYFDGLLRYFEFSGRSSRSQYWLFQLVYVVLIVAAVFADLKLNGSPVDGHHFGLFLTFIIFFHLVPQVTVTVRRLHDTGRSGWWYLLGFVPFGGLFVLYWTCCRSEEGPNPYGDLQGGMPSGTEPMAPFRQARGSAGVAQARFARMQERRAR